MKKMLYLLLIACLSLYNCSTENNPIDDTDTEANELYFPPINSSIWSTSTISELQWSESELSPLLNFLETNNTKAFIILKNGKIVVEEYFNNHTQNSNWYWASAGKTLTAFTLGIAQEEGFLNLNDASSIYLGNGWSSLTPEQENAITVEHHITMTTGLDYTVNNTFCTDADCLTFLNSPGDFWYYHNAPYTLTQSIITGALTTNFDTYFKEKVRDPIGMQGTWTDVGFNRLYFSTARSMARFGLLCLNKGVWENQTIMTGSNYFEAMTNTSQTMNESYGYLWWLNGKNSFRLPGLTTEFSGKLIPNAPNDLIAGLGANDQKLYIIPSESLVIIRMGNDAGQGELGPSSFDNLLWEKINALTN
jgi:CubicO group peptidase (beta-lactamase class C family)